MSAAPTAVEATAVEATAEAPEQKALASVGIITNRGIVDPDVAGSIEEPRARVIEASAATGLGVDAATLDFGYGLAVAPSHTESHASEARPSRNSQFRVIDDTAMTSELRR